MPELIRDCIDSWKILENAGYEIKQWDESNCTFNENEFVRMAYEQKRYGYIGDYYRAKILYDHGGIYLDTDVLVKKSFDDLLENNRAFIGFMFDCMIGTAIIGSEKGGSFVKKLMDMYDEGKYPTEESTIYHASKKDGYAEGEWVTSNVYYTWRMIEQYPEFKLNNKMQKLSDVTVYPDNYFDRGSIHGDEYSIHMYTGTWLNNVNVTPIKRKLKTSKYFSRILAVRRIIIKKKLQKQTRFYKYRSGT